MVTVAVAVAVAGGGVHGVGEMQLNTHTMAGLVRATAALLVCILTVLLLWYLLWKFVLEPNPLIRDFFDLDEAKTKDKEKDKAKIGKGVQGVQGAMKGLSKEVKGSDNANTKEYKVNNDGSAVDNNDDDSGNHDRSQAGGKTVRYRH
jgi:hypothetical protein